MGKEKQYHLHLRPGDVGRYVLLPGDPGRVPTIAAHLADAREVAFNREYRTFTGTLDGAKVSATSTGIGCPSAAIAVEELLRVGADTFIRVGTAGSLQPEVDVGHVCVTTAAVREEGTTRQYVPLAYPAVADLAVTSALVVAGKKLGLPVHAGISHCKDAFFSEGDEGLPRGEWNEERWKAWRRARVLSTSMESSAIFVVSSIRGARAGEVLSIIGRTWDKSPIVKGVGVEDAIRVAIEAVRILAARDGEGP